MEREERITDANLCMAKLKKTKAGKAYMVYNLFIYDEDLDKICTPVSYFSGEPKYLNLHPDNKGKKYVYMDTEVLFFKDLLNFENSDIRHVTDKLKRMMPPKAYDLLFGDIIVPALGSGVSISNLVKVNGQFVTAQMVDKEPGILTSREVGEVGAFVDSIKVSYPEITKE